jgi:hypothetical protein
MKQAGAFFLVTVSLLATALACNFSVSPTSPTPDIAALVAQTQTAIAVAQVLTPVAPSPQAQQPPTTPAIPPTTSPTAQAAQPESPTPQAAQCTDKAKYITETVPDNTQIAANEQFMKTWTLQNAGTCTWTANYELVFVKGEQMGGSSPAPIGQSVPPNGSIQIYLPQTAPPDPGPHEGHWMLRNNATGKTFGLGENADVAFWVKVNVVPANPAPTAGAQVPGNPTWVYTFDDKQSPFYLGPDGDISFDIQNGDLVLTAFEPAGDQWRVAEPGGMDNFTLEVDFQTGPACSGKDAYGMIVRAPSQPDDVIDSGYVFTFSCDGQYRIYRMDSGNYNGLVNWSTNPAIRSGPNQANKMTVKAQGDQFQVYANGTLLYQLPDATYPYGLFGLVIGSGGTENFQVRVKQIAFWDLP